MMIRMMMMMIIIIIIIRGKKNFPQYDVTFQFRITYV
jgi:hypothetical protein